jgi:hypothetical protein
MTITAISGAYDPVYIAAQIRANISYTINQSADSSQIVAFVKGLVPNVSVSIEGVSSDGTTYVNLLATTAVNYVFQIYQIKINGTVY